jgi:hypothetical protein
MNSLMERWIQTCRRELLDRTSIWNYSHLLHALREFETFYNQHRPHRTSTGRVPVAAATRSSSKNRAGAAGRSSVTASFGSRPKRGRSVTTTSSRTAPSTTWRGEDAARRDQQDPDGSDRDGAEVHHPGQDVCGDPRSESCRKV